MLTSQYITEELAVRVGQTLIHSLWQIALIGFFFFVVNRALVRRSANLRYIVGCVAMVLMLVVPVGWLVFATETNPDGGAIEAASVSADRLDGVGPSEFGSPASARDGSNFESTWASRGTPTEDRLEVDESSVSKWHWIERLAAAVWLVGVILFSLRPALGFSHARRLCRVGNADVPESVHVLLRRVAETMNVGRVVQVAQSTLARVPCVVGWLRPVILLPASVVTGLSAAEMESILAHELAHIRRHDYAVNVVQIAIETLLFFHPVMWWVSRCVRREREYCCDDLALQVCGDRAVLTDALLAVGGVVTRSRLAMASDGTVLFERVARILEPSETQKDTSQDRTRIVLAVLVALLFVIIGSTFVFIDDEGETNSPQKETVMASKSTKGDSMKKDGGYNYSGVDLGEPINQWQKAIETRDANEVARLLVEHPEFANTKIMDRKRDGSLNTEGHHQEALDHVARTGHLEIAKLLVEAGANAERIRGAFMLAEPNVAEFLLEHCDDPNPDVGLMAYIGKWRAMQFWFDRGYKPEMQMLHDACCGRPSMRHFAMRADNEGEWKEHFRETVRVLIEADADVNERTLGGNQKWGGAKPWRKNRETPLHIAASSHDIVLIQQLLDAGADKTLKNDLGDTPCCWAIRYNAPAEVVELLDFEGNTRRNPELWWAAHQGDLDTVKAMIEAGADPNAYEENGSGTLLNFHPEVTRFLISKGAKPDLQRNENILPVLVGVAGFNTDCVKAMLDADANPNIICEHNGETALHHSVCGDRFEEVEALLDAGADPNKRTHNERKTFIGSSDGQCHGETCLHRAAAYGTPEVIKLLLDNGGDLTKTDADGKTPHEWGEEHNRPKAITDLLGGIANAKTSSNTRSDEDPSQELRDQLAAAIEAKDVSAVEELLTAEPLLANADLRESKDRDVFSNGHPLQRACEHNNQQLAELLLNHGSHADAPGPDPDGRPVHGMPLHLAAVEHQNYALANVLLDHGATPNSYPNCDSATIECMFYHAREAGMADSLVRRSFASYLPDQSKLETQTATDLAGDDAAGGDAAEAIKLFARMVDLGAQPPFTGLVREGFDDLVMEIVEYSRDKDGTPHDHPNSSAADNIFGAARWLGYPKLVRRLMDHSSYQYSYDNATCTISAAIGSHNRDGSYPEYREIILMQLEALKTNGDLKKAQQDSDYNPFFNMAGHFNWGNNYGFRAEIAKPECYIDLAELFVSWGFENIEHRDPESDHSPLSTAVKRGNPTAITYIRWLLEKGADLRTSDPDAVNPNAIATAKGHEETLKILENFRP